MATLSAALTDDSSSTDKLPGGVDSGGEFQQVILQLPPEDEEDFKEWIGVASRIRIMVTGETGVGKSTLLNAIVGQKVFKTDDEDKQRVTTEVSEHICHNDKLKIEIVAIDCPGLHDGTKNEDKYIREMKAMIDKYGGIDLLLYCQEIDRTRVDFEKDRDIISKLTDGLGKDIWKHALFVLTHANVYEKQLRDRLPRADERNTAFKEKKKEWKCVIQEIMTKCNIKCDVKVCAAGSRRPKLFNCDYWFSSMWAAAFEVVDENAGLALVRLGQSRMVNPIMAMLQPGRFKADLDEQPIVLNNKVLKALGIASAAGGAGAAVGAAVGATIGAVFIGVISFGPAAGAGLAIGACLGAAVGSSIGSAVFALYMRRKAKKLAQQSTK